MHYVDKSVPDWSQPRLPMTASGVAWQVTSANYATAGLNEKKRKVSEETVGNVEKDMHTHKG